MKNLIYSALLIVIVSGAVPWHPDDSSSPATSTNPVRSEDMTVTASTPVEAGNSSSSIETGDAENSSGFESTPSDSDDLSTWTWNCSDKKRDRLRNQLKESLRPNETLIGRFSDVFIGKEWRLHNESVQGIELLDIQLCVGNLPESCHHSSMPKEDFFGNLSIMLFSYHKLFEGRPTNRTDALPHKSLFAAIKRKIGEAILRLRNIRTSCFERNMQISLLRKEKQSAKPSKVLDSLYAYLADANVSGSSVNFPADGRSYCGETVEHPVANKEAIADPLTIDHILYYKAMESLLHVVKCPMDSILSATQIAN